VSQIPFSFAASADPVNSDLPEPEIEYVRHFLKQSVADELFEELFNEIPWQQDTISMWGKTHPIPRLQQWFADDGITYTWSGIEMAAMSWTPALGKIRQLLFEHTGIEFNSALANLYRDGSDTVGWHSDDEPELGAEPVIASVSLGAQRDFQIRHKNLSDVPTIKLSLEHGSLLLMRGTTQRDWKHQLPRRKKVSKPRINLTFRNMNV
jgi:alkylated DNA repair dioxygenase AlkB